MSTEPNGAPQALPDGPNLGHLKDQAKDSYKDVFRVAIETILTCKLGVYFVSLSNVAHSSDPLN